MEGGGDRTERSGNSNAQDEKGKAIAADEVRLEMLEMSGVDRKATERVYAGGKDTEREEDGLDSADMEEEKGCA